MNNLIDNNQYMAISGKNTILNKKYEKNNTNTINLQKNFLTLLMAQIKNQDPIDPMKNTELTSQLAQINTVGQMEKLNHTVEQLVIQNQKNKSIQASSLIGHRVLTPSSNLIHSKNNSTPFGIELLHDAEFVNIEIKDKKNKIVFDKNIKNMKSGMYHFLWNGKNLNQEDVDTGKYHITVKAKNQNKNITTHTFVQSLVKSIIVSQISKNPIVNLGLSGTTLLSNIREIFG
ncbi:flagellar hook assembly protein FlgD [Buchnera aphidicola]|uniref:flagellar hook assembly protein FlgD n=1 Tax=Buchnera aphidicola TaxID=9 RepID=UPI003BEEC76E